MDKIICGDCIEVMKDLPDNSVDSIVTDPPYGLEFMGKDWDKGVPNVNFWGQMLRVLKPGGYLLSFGGSRTYHRMASAIEDAGFEIRDQIMWLYGSGFPKSLNIGKQIDKKLGNEREVVSKNPNVRPNCNPQDNTLYEYGSTGKTEPITKGTSQWEGWGTALKPAHEPIVVARKPLSEKNVASNVLKWGTGGINIDGCRIEGVTPNRRADKEKFIPTTDHQWGSITKRTEYNNTQGRFPANIILDEVAGQMLDEQSGMTKSCDTKRTRLTIGSFGMPNDKTPEYSDKGGASRFFYCAKASKSERNYGCEELEEKITKVTNMYEMERKDGTMRELAVKKNNHPTVKPIKLMRYLVRLVTPKGGVVLDPFLGSGTTAIACVQEGMKFIGIEKEAEYVKIAEARLKPFMEQRRLNG